MKNKLYKADILFEHIEGKTTDVFHIMAISRFQARRKFKKRINAIGNFKCLKVTNIKRCVNSGRSG
jgi:hypothetical protein